MLSTFLLNKFSHLRSAYNSDKEFIDHFLSGEVTVPFTDVLKVVDEYIKNEPPLPSQFQIRQVVKLCFDEKTKHTATVNAVHFYENKVKYDLSVWVGEGGNEITRVYNIDSFFVKLD
jgi:hypothetical protein